MLFSALNSKFCTLFMTPKNTIRIRKCVIELQKLGKYNFI